MKNVETLFQEERERYASFKSDLGYNLDTLSIAIAKEKECSVMTYRLLLMAMLISNADGGTLYILKEETLYPQFFVNRILNLHLSDASWRHQPQPEIPLYDVKGNPNSQFTVVRTVLEKICLNIPDIQKETNYSFSGSGLFDQTYRYQTHSLLTIPLLSYDETIGVVQLVNAMAPNSQQVIEFNGHVQSEIEYLFLKVLQPAKVGFST